MKIKKLTLKVILIHNEFTVLNLWECRAILQNIPIKEYIDVKVNKNSRFRVLRRWSTDEIVIHVEFDSYNIYIFLFDINNKRTFYDVTIVAKENFNWGRALKSMEEWFYSTKYES